MTRKLCYAKIYEFFSESFVFPMDLNNSNKSRYAKIYGFFQELFIFFQNCNNSALDVFLRICNSKLTALSEQNQVVECKSTLVRQHFQVKNDQVCCLIDLVRGCGVLMKQGGQLGMGKTNNSLKKNSPHKVGEEALTEMEPLFVKILPVAFGPE